MPRKHINAGPRPGSGGAGAQAPFAVIPPPLGKPLYSTSRSRRKAGPVPFYQGG